jgi:predicted secreted protein
MSTTGSLIVYISIWWIVFFSVLPFGVKPQNAKLTDELHGNDRGAPKNPQIRKKFLITTLITSIIFLVIYYLVSQNYLNLRGYLQ